MAGCEERTYRNRELRILCVPFFLNVRAAQISPPSRCGRKSCIILKFLDLRLFLVEQKHKTGKQDCKRKTETQRNKIIPPLFWRHTKEAKKKHGFPPLSPIFETTGKSCFESIAKVAAAAAYFGVYNTHEKKKERKLV